MRHHLYHQQHAIAASRTPGIPRRNRAAVDELAAAYRRQFPLAVMTGAGTEASRLVIDAFLAGIHDAHDVIRLTAPGGRPIDCLTSMLRALEFETDGLELADLYQVLRMFLAYQRTHRRRTILCVENAHEASGWTLDLVEGLVKQETADRCGLVVLLVGNESLDDRLRTRALAPLAGEVGLSLRVAPLELDETRVYVQRYVEATAGRPVSEVFEFDAITRVHDVTDGVPDTINQLIGECLDCAGDAPVSPDLVERAVRAIEAPVECPAPELDVLTDVGGGELVVRLDGEVVDRRVIDSAKLVIGRKSTCDLRLAGKSVSREHAALLWLDAGLRLVDLGSTNGTLVDGEPVDNRELKARAIISLGDFEVEFVPPG